MARRACSASGEIRSAKSGLAISSGPLPAIAAGRGPEEIASPDFADRISPLAEQALLAMYHAQQARAWTANIVNGFETTMAKAGIHSRLERLPAICFLD